MQYRFPPMGRDEFRQNDCCLLAIIMFLVSLIEKIQQWVDHRTQRRWDHDKRDIRPKPLPLLADFFSITWFQFYEDTSDVTGNSKCITHGIHDSAMDAGNRYNGTELCQRPQRR